VDRLCFRITHLPATPFVMLKHNLQGYKEAPAEKSPATPIVVVLPGLLSGIPGDVPLSRWLTLAKFCQGVSPPAKTLL